MKCFLAILCLTAACAFAEEHLPAGAKEVRPFTYSYTDAQGKTWIYRQTPFGLTKSSAADAAQQTEVKDAGIRTKATDLGDSVRFERATPFGVSVWTKKKADLDASERALIEPVKPPAAAAAGHTQPETK